MYYKCDLEEGQKLMLEVLRYVDNICSENNIEYSLAAGTLLGAYRHGGFIPWDDDVDILMTRDNHKRFVEVMKSKNDDFYLLDKSITDDYAFEFSKVMMKDTKCGVDNSGSTIKMHRGIFIDVFIVDFYNKNLSQKYRRLLRQFENARRDVVVNSVQSKGLKLVLKVFKLISNIILPVNLIDLVEKKCRDINGSYVGYLINQEDTLWIERGKYFPLKKIEFCGEAFSCPNNVEAVLRAEYGDTYMQLPPESQRIAHVEYISIKKNIADKYNVSIDNLETVS